MLPTIRGRSFMSCYVIARAVAFSDSAPESALCSGTGAILKRLG